MDFVSRTGTHFAVDGHAVRFTGTNSYYLGWVSRRMVDATFDAAKELGVEVLRTWGFLDEPASGVVYQSWNDGRPVYHEDGLVHLDYALAAARERGIRLILPLVNNWKDLGGIPAYQSWLGLTRPQEFYSDARARQTYRDWCRTVVTRVNTINGIAYKDDPTVFAWELTNEARCDGDPGTLLRWADEMSRAVKTLDGNHLVAMGDEGFFNRLWPKQEFFDGSHGADFDQFLQLDAIDFGTLHLYPWDQPETFGSKWIRRHAKAGARWNKPVMLEEYGWLDKERRGDVYAKWLETVREVDLAADLFWMFAVANDDGTPYYDDGFTFYPATVPAEIREHIRWSLSRSSGLL
ncbi:MAG TPA: cellulase family glycosylhydrolase [Bryobacteraceae bacterium]